MTKAKVLILDGDAAHAVAIMECLKKSGYATAVICSETLSYGYHSRLADERFVGPDSHSPEYDSFLIDFLKNNHFDVLIPTSDATAEFMSRNKAELRPITGVLMPDMDVFMKAYDKNQLMEVCRCNKFPHPLTVDLSKTPTDAPELKKFPFPALIKPNLTSGGRGMTLVNNFAEFKETYPNIKEQYGDCHLQQFIKPGGRQIKVQIFTDNNCHPLCSSVIWKQRYYPVNGGSSCCNITIEDDKTVEICSMVLKKIGWVGFADFDLIENPLTGELLIMEINPRIPACVRSAFKSGADYATMIADTVLNKSIKKQVYRPGVRLRHLGFDILWFLKSPNRLTVKPSWFRFFGRKTYYQDWVGFGVYSFICGTLGNLRKLRNSEFRAAKGGVKI